MNDQPSLEYRLAKLLADYLTHVRQQNGLPTTLNIGIGLEMAARQRPCVVCHIDMLEFPHSKLIEAAGIMVLHTHADETPVLTEAIWVASLRSALTNRGALFSWISTLPEVERTGWDIRRLRITRSDAQALIQQLREGLLEQSKPQHPLISAYNARCVHDQILRHLHSTGRRVLLRKPRSLRSAFVSEQASDDMLDRVQRHFRIA